MADNSSYSKGYRVGQQVGIERAKVGNVSSRQDARTANKPQQYRPNRLRTTATFEEESANLKENAKNMAVRGGMILFWLVAGIAVAKDLIDVFSALLDLVGTGLAATAVGAPVGIPILFISEIIDKIAGILIDFTLVAYFGYIGGGFALRLVVMSIGGIIDMIPGVDVLPLTTVSFFAAYLLGRGVKKAFELASSSPVKAVMGGAKFVRNSGARLGRIAKYVSQK